MEVETVNLTKANIIVSIGTTTTTTENFSHFLNSEQICVKIRIN